MLPIISRRNPHPQFLMVAHLGWLNVNNGARFETYTITGTPGANEVIVNDAAARVGQRGDKIMIITHAQLSESEIPGHRPRVIYVDEKNRVVGEVA